MLQQMKKFFLYLRKITLKMASDRDSEPRFDKLTPSNSCATELVRSLFRALSDRITMLLEVEMSFFSIFTSALIRNFG
jgi:hypothetical protein